MALGHHAHIHTHTSLSCARLEKLALFCSLLNSRTTSIANTRAAAAAAWNIHTFQMRWMKKFLFATTKCKFLLQRNFAFLFQTVICITSILLVQSTDESYIKRTSISFIIYFLCDIHSFAHRSIKFIIRSGPRPYK